MEITTEYINFLHTYSNVDMIFVLISGFVFYCLQQDFISSRIISSVYAQIWRDYLENMKWFSRAIRLQVVSHQINKAFLVVCSRPRQDYKDIISISLLALRNFCHRV